MASELSPGDVVRLNSGGPKMTVQTVARQSGDGVPLVICVWFDDNGFHKQEIAAAALKKFASGKEKATTKKG